MSKFGEAFVHVAWSFSSVQRIYDVLFAADCMHYLAKGSAITGVQWKKTQDGPKPSIEDDLIVILLGRKAIDIVYADNPLEDGIRIRPLRKPSWIEFAMSEIDVLDRFARLSVESPERIQEYLRDHIGLQVARDGEILPISTSLVWAPGAKGPLTVKENVP